MLPIPINETEEQLIRIFNKQELPRELKIQLIQDLAYPDQSQDLAVGTPCVECPPPHARKPFVENLLRSFEKRYTVTIYIAHPGTPLNDNEGNPLILDGERKTSSAGHMWYQISNFEEEISYGFAPIKTGISGPGSVTKFDTIHYEKPYYSRTLEIREDQYLQLKNYGELSVNKKNPNFNLKYNGLSNSCIDFTWKALNSAELGSNIDWKRDTPQNQLEKAMGIYEGHVKVHSNIPSIKKIIPPYPNSNLNKERSNPAPSKTFLQRKLTKNDQKANTNTEQHQLS